MIPYARQSIGQAEAAAVIEVLASDFLTQGPVVPRFEERLAAFCGATHAVAVSNATSALHIAVRALGLSAGGRLWTSPNSFVASSNCALYCGAQVDFVDVDPRTYNMSVPLLARKLEDAQNAGRLPDVVVAVDFAGQPCELDALAELRAQYGFRIVEDASHAVGARYREARIGSGAYADVTVFSFHPVKIVTTAEGGMALTGDVKVAQTMQLLRSHGITRDPQLMTGAPEPWEYEQVMLGFNYRLTEIQAALGVAQMDRIESFLARRRAIAARYDAELAHLPLVLPYHLPHVQPAYHLYPVQVSPASPLNRRELYDRLQAGGIAANVHYRPIYLQPYYRNLGFERGHCPNAEAYYARALSLPMYPGLSDEEQDRVIDVLSAALR
ncbi:MAG: UDP-4-amino-4,6-dideoxy-N-acetyl-beta-L-altrosamine transaminase [Candidatus Baltobacteraceae bacterium]